MFETSLNFVPVAKYDYTHETKSVRPLVSNCMQSLEAIKVTGSDVYMYTLKTVLISEMMLVPRGISNRANSNDREPRSTSFTFCKPFHM